MAQSQLPQGHRVGRNAAHDTSGAFEKKQIGAHDLRTLLSHKKLLLVNFTEAGFFNTLAKWLDEKNYFQKRSIYDTCNTQVEASEHLEHFAPDFVFLHLEPNPQAALDFARFAKSFCPNAKIVLFYPGSREEFDSQFKNHKNYELYDCLSPDKGHARLRGLLQRISD